MSTVCEANGAPTRRRGEPPARLRDIPRRVRDQLDVIIERDPSMRSRGEALFHPTVLALLGHRCGHRLYRRGAFRTAKALSIVARLVSGGIEIHPGARIGRRFFIDHGCGVVIGETAIVGDEVTLFHQVTLGSVGWWHDRARGAVRRHPRLGNGVTVGAGATLLGPITVGDNALVGAQALVLSDVPPGARVHASTATVVTERPGRTTDGGPLTARVDGAQR